MTKKLKALLPRLSDKNIFNLQVGHFDLEGTDPIEILRDSWFYGDVYDIQ
jgi:hypothetical protein